MLCLRSIIYVTNIEISKTKNNSKFYKVKATYARGIIINDEIKIKHYGEEKLINIFYNYIFNCIAWNKTNEDDEYFINNIKSTNISIFNALEIGVIKAGTLLSGAIIKKEVEKYCIGETTHSFYSTPVLWDSIFHDYQDRNGRENFIFSLANRKILPEDSVDYNESNSDYEPYTREDSFDDAFGGEDEAYRNID